MTYDLIIIGAGPGGYEMAAEAAQHQLTVLLVEKDLLGGTCLNRGCIPTKALCRNAEILNNVRSAQDFGISTGEISFNFPAVMERKDNVVTQLRQGVEMLLNNPQITIANGEASLVSPHSVKVNEETYEGSNIVIATGSAPRGLNIPGAELALTSDDILQIKALPKSLCIIGGGVIGMEFAGIFSSFGTEVTVVEYCKEILPPFDKDIAKRLRQTLAKRGITFATGAAVTSLEKKDESVVVTYEQKRKTIAIETQEVLMAVGRRPVIPSGAEEVGIRLYRQGIEVDDDFRTSVPGIFAVGDVNGRCMLAHAATAQAMHVLHLITGKNCGIDLNVVPSAVFTSPELAMVGLTEERCQELELNFEAKKSFFRSNGKAVAMDETDGLVKMIVNSENGQILGCHICGAHAADLIQEVATVMNAHIPISKVSDAIHGHPTLSEVVANAAKQFVN